jgi:tetratricopeptide (TPR) repeat protein
MWFVAPAVIEWITGIRLSQARYSSGVLAIMHSAQYLWVTSYYARREAEAAPAGAWRPWAYAGTLVAGGIALFVPGPWLASYMFGSDFTTSVLVFTAVVNIHHFVLDGAIWKLRDMRIARFLIDSPRLAASGAAETGRVLQGLAGWLGSSQPAARALRVAALAALAAWAALDQARYVFATSDDSLPALERAASLNPYDAALLGRRERLLAAEGRQQEAYDLYASYLARRPNNADALARMGVLAFQLGKHDEAVAHWQSALAANPRQPAARRFLAQVWSNSADKFESEGRDDEAAQAYREALKLDEGNGDATNEGADWFNYGQLLRKRGADPRLVAGCFIHAGRLLASTSDSRLDEVRGAIAALERDHGDAVQAARQNFPATLAEALQKN